MIGCRVETGWATTRDDVFRKAYSGNMLWIRCVTSSTCHPYWVMNKSLAFKLIEYPTQQSVLLQWHHQLRPCTCNRWRAYNTKRRDFLECVDIYYLLKSGEMEVILLEYVNLTQLSPVTNRRPDRQTQRYCEKYCVLLSINKSCPCQRHEGEYRYCPTRSELGRKVEVSGEHDAPVALYPKKKEPQCPLNRKICGPKSRCWRSEKKEKSLLAAGIRKPDHLVTIPTSLSRIRTLDNKYGNRSCERERQVLP
jgi:hypothetical protein